MAVSHISGLKMTIAEAISLASRLAEISDTPRLDAELLLSFATGFDRTYFYTWPEKTLQQSELIHYLNLLSRRQQGEPIAHITGKREFWSLNLSVNASTLIPRPDTEVLVEAALRHLPKSTKRILDLGTGTGAIALALAKELPATAVLAIDQSADAVALAKQNTRTLSFTNVTVEAGSWFDEVWISKLHAEDGFDLIVSNPPYIDAKDPHLQIGDVRFEPRSALVADNQGLADIEAIVKLATKILNKDGMLWLEHGWQQAEAVSHILSDAGFDAITTLNDYGGNPRVTGGVAS